MDQERDHVRAPPRGANLFAQILGVRPTICPAMKTPTIKNRSRLTIPTPLPPKMQFSHMPTIGESRRDRVETVVLAVDRAASHVDGQRRKGRSRRCTEPHFLAFQISQDAARREAAGPPGPPGSASRRPLSDRGSGSWPTLLPVKPGFGCSVS